MKKVFLFIMLAFVCNAASAQKELFMQILENKKICNKEDELTWFIQTNSFERRNANHYYHRYVIKGMLYTTCIINENECYVTYQTNNVKDYNAIKSAIAGMCTKELAANKTPCYVCNQKRIQDVQIIFSGYSEMEKVYEILVYQNPEKHEPPYNQADRVKAAK
jgi:hypothetical protein